MPIYLDNAATSYPKPDSVYAAMDHYNRNIGAPGGRGSYASATDAQSTMDRCRKLTADLLGVASPAQVAFTFNCTDSLNSVLHGLLRPGDHVVTSQIDHNSVLRPLNKLQAHGVESTVVPVGPNHLISPDSVRRAIKSNTRLLSLIHASNVTGVVQPIEEIAQIARERGVLVLLDAAQTAGQLPINMADLPVDFLAAAGHKSLLGPLGTGVLCLRPGVEEHLQSFRQGGTGSSSEQAAQPTTLPYRYESGNHNMPGLFGLTAGLEHITTTGIDAIREHEQKLMHLLSDGLSAIEGVCLFVTGDVETTSVLSLNITGYEPHDVATILDQNFQIQARAGLHCAPGAHEALGTLTAGGTVRLSPGPFTTPEDVEAAVAAVREIAGAMVG
jgi:cysteine desulfurase family protein